MKENEFEISSNLFGGYNRKSTEAYIRELQSMITEIQKENDALRHKNGQLEQKLQEAEGCYRILWEKSKGQEVLIQKQETMIAGQQEVLENLSKDKEGSMKRLEQTLSRQMKKLREKSLEYGRKERG